MNVMITGAAGGLGRAIAVECAKRKYNIFLTDLNYNALQHIKKGIECQFEVNVIAKYCDLTDSKNVDELLYAIDNNGIYIDMLINVAGIDFEGSFLQQERENIAKIVSLNNEGTVRITHAILERQRKGRHFIIIFVSSLASLFPMPLKATYAASKRFLFDFAIAIRKELKQRSTSVLVLCPGGMATNDTAIKAINAQGMWGEITTNPLETVARKTIDKALKKKNCYIPGVVNRIIYLLSKFIPKTWVASVVFWRWNKTQKKWLNVYVSKKQLYQ